jgi:hypothetical protein
MKALNANPRMIGLPGVVDLPKFYELLGRDAEFVYGATPWVPKLVELRAGGLIPIARQYPGAREFVESYNRIAHACRGRRPDHTSQKCPGGRRSIRLLVGLIV